MATSKEPTKDDVRESLKFIEVRGDGGGTVTSDTPTTADAAFAAKNLGAVDKNGIPIVKGSIPPPSQR